MQSIEGSVIWHLFDFETTLKWFKMDPFAFLNRNLFLEIKDFQINHTHHHILYTYSHIFISQAVSINDEDETSNNINIQIYTFEKKIENMFP